jgi:hypothetical protein
MALRRGNMRIWASHPKDMGGRPRVIRRNLSMGYHYVDSRSGSWLPARAFAVMNVIKTDLPYYSLELRDADP